jgi:pimeloyl-ACP methyl ester carboxylesterase
MSRIPMPDVVVLLPGITGSVLQRDGKDIWAPSAGAVLRGLLSFGRSVQKLQLQVVDDDWRAPDLGDGVTATRLAPDVHLLPGFWKIDGYTEIEDFLLRNFELTRGENYHPFPYDWRRDNRAAAARLAQESEGWLRSWRRRSGRDSAQLVLVGHSMGGLVARYFVEALGGWKDTRAVVTFGTPYYGSLNAVDFLINGFHKDVGPLQLDLTPVLRSCTSVHQLVPLYRCIYPPDGNAVTPAKAGLPGWKPAWDQHLVDFQTEMEQAAAANRADPAFARNPVVYRPIVGTDQPTRQSARMVGDQVELRMDRGGSDEAGDGTVPLVSAALAGTEDQRTFAPQRHSRLQNYNPMLDHLKGVLASLYQVRIDDLRATVTAWFSYDGDDMYLPEEPVRVRLRAHVAVTEELMPQVEATVRVIDLATGGEVLRRDLQVRRQWQDLELQPLDPGAYRVEVHGRSDTAPISDVLTVAAPEELAAP